MEFTKQLIDTDFAPIKPGKHSLFNNGSIPNNKDVFIKAKWHEVFDRYESARMMLMQADYLEDCGWINSIDDVSQREFMKLRQKSYFYESALTFYNILIDLSWVFSYVAMEFIIYQKDENGNDVTINVEDFSLVDDAYEILRKLESSVSNPDSEGNPLEYFKHIEPGFSSVISSIQTFWATFKESKIRNRYNYMKHRGMPVYDEIKKYLVPPFNVNIEIEGKNIPSSVFDVQNVWNLDECIKELISFDNDVLFDYITKLVREINFVIQPSEIII